MFIICCSIVMQYSHRLSRKENQDIMLQAYKNYRLDSLNLQYCKQKSVLRSSRIPEHAGQKVFLVCSPEGV